jgi:hypothetical protein
LALRACIYHLIAFLLLFKFFKILILQFIIFKILNVRPLNCSWIPSFQDWNVLPKVSILFSLKSKFFHNFSMKDHIWLTIRLKRLYLAKTNNLSSISPSLTKWHMYFVSQNIKNNIKEHSLCALPANYILHTILANKNMYICTNNMSDDNICTLHETVQVLKALVSLFPVIKNTSCREYHAIFGGKTQLEFNRFTFSLEIVLVVI